MADFPTRKGIPLDYILGSLSQPGEGVTPPPADFSQIQVFVSGDAASDTRAIGLPEDLRLLVQGFVHRSRTSDRKAAPDIPASDENGDIRIALHGLHLAPEELRELRQMIRGMVRKRLPGKEATK
jgi:hypothetical protein